MTDLGLGKTIDLTHRLKEGVNEAQFIKKLDDVLSDNKLTKSEFKSLAAKLNGGEASLKKIITDVLPKNEVADMLSGIWIIGSKSIRIDNNKKEELRERIKGDLIIQDINDPRGALKVPNSITVKVMSPGVRATVKKDIKINDIVFKTNEKCLFIEKDDKTYIQKLSVDKNGKPTNPYGDSIELTEDQVKNITKDQTFIKTNEELFKDGKVSTRDVKQGEIGNCYAIAAIYSIAQKDPNIIKKMMRDNGDGTVTLKLYDKDKDDTISPKYIKIEKSVLSTKEHASGSLWVQMLEKGYASLKGSYQEIGQGGWSKDALTTFLGKDFIRTEFDKKSLEKLIIESSSQKRTLTKNNIDFLKSKLNGSNDLDKIINASMTVKDLINKLKNDFNLSHDYSVNIVGEIFPSEEVWSISEMVENLSPYSKFEKNEINSLKEDLNDLLVNKLKKKPLSEDQIKKVDSFIGKDINKEEISKTISESLGITKGYVTQLVEKNFFHKSDEILKDNMTQKQFDNLIKELKEKYPISIVNNKDKNDLITQLENEGKGYFNTSDFNYKTDEINQTIENFILKDESSKTDDSDKLDLNLIGKMIQDLGFYSTFGKLEIADFKKDLREKLKDIDDTNLKDIDNLVGKEVKQNELIHKIKSFGLEDSIANTLVDTHFPKKDFNIDDILKKNIVRKTFEDIMKGLKEKYPISDVSNKDKNDLITKFENKVEKMFSINEDIMKNSLKFNYKPEEIKMFNDIKNALENDKFVCISTNVNIGTSTGKGFSGGESMVDGLVGQHAYAVIDTFQMGGRMFVKVANPWGNNFSRDYTVNPDGSLQTKRYNKDDYNYLKNAKKNDEGPVTHENESWIELNNISSDFNAIHIAK